MSDEALKKADCDGDESVSAWAVFRNDYLRDKILDLAIHNDDRSINRQPLVNLRQVQKSWRTTIDHRLYHLKEPLYTLKLDESNSLNGAPLVEAKGKALDRFTAFFGVNGEEETFELKLCERFFRQENYDSLSKCLRRCSPGLVQLELVVPVNVGSFPGIFPGGGLPNLQKLTMTLTATVLDTLYKDLLSNRPGNATVLLATILLQSPTLKELTVSSERGDSNRRVFPPVLRYLALPPDLTKLALGYPLTAEDLGVLEQNPLSSLTELVVAVTGLPLPEGTLFNVLSGCKDTLKEFSITGRKSERRVLNVLKLPEMKKLTSLKLQRFSAVLDDDTKGNLIACLPKLELLVLKLSSKQMPATIDTWTENTSLETVKTLILYVSEFVDSRFRIMPSPTLMDQILVAMPNVETLTLGMDGKYPADLTRLFEKLGGIKCLTVKLTNVDCIGNSDVWDSLLTGLSRRMANEIRLNPEKNFGNTETTPSIRMLKNLESLTLLNNSRYSNVEPLLSHVAFRHAFLQMPNLRSLVLQQRFKVSQEIVQEWEQAGRIIRQD